MSIVKSTAYILSSTIVRALNGLVVLKILALHTNPAEFGYLSQVMGVIALFGMLAAGGIGNGLTRQLAASQNKLDQFRWLVVAMRIYIATSAVLAVVLILTASHLAIWLVGDHGYAVVFICLSVGQAIVGASNLAQSIAAARADYLFTLRISIYGAVLGAITVAVGIQLGGVIGGAIALVINPAVPGLVAIAIKRHSLVHLVGRVGEKVDNKDAIRLLKYALVVLLGASSLAISQVGSRILVAQSLGWGAVGFWQTVTRISDVYMQLISVLLISFVLPRLAAHKNFADMHLAFLRLSVALCGLFLVAALTIYVLRDILISLLFARNFLPAADLLLPQLVGDFFRVIAVCLSVALLARGQTKISMIYESLQGIIAYTLTAILLGYMTSIAPVLAYCFTYAILMLFLLYSYRSQFSKECGK